MKNPFEKQGDSARHLKIAVTGPISSGKTCFGLDAKNHDLGPVAVLSLEAGEVQFVNSKRWGGFKPLRTQSIAEMEEAIEFLEGNPGVFGTLVVDTITGIYEAVVDAKMKDDGSMTRNTWGVVKRSWKSLMLRLVNLPLHVVFVVHELDLTETDKEGNTKVVGQKLDAEKTFGRAPDFLLRLTMGTDGKPSGRVLKLRGDDTGFKVGQVIPEPHLGMFVAAIKKGAHEVRVSPPEEVASANEAALSASPVTTTTAMPTLEQDRAAAIQLVKACEEGFKAQPHKDNWLKKHREEISGLKKRHPDLYEAIKKAYDAAHVGAEKKEQAA